MFNLLKMDVRRLFKSRGFYILLGVTATIILAMILLVAKVSDLETLDTMQSQGIEIVAADRQQAKEIRNMSQLDIIYECFSSGILLMMIGIGVTLFVNSDFSSGYIKNICFVLPRRQDYVLSKLLLTGVYSGILTILGVLVSLVSPFLFGLRPAASPVVGILQYAFWLWLPCWAFGLMGLVLALLTRNSTLGIILAVISSVGLTVTILQSVCRQLGWPALEQYLLSSVQQFQCVPMPDTKRMFMILGCSLGWAALYTVGSLLTIKKRDI